MGVGRRQGARALPDMQSHAAGVGQRLKEVLQQLRVVGTDAVCGRRDIKAEVWPA